jgi:hypothetical protein
MLHPLAIVIPIAALIYDLYHLYQSTPVCASNAQNALCFTGPRASAAAENMHVVNHILDNCDPDNMNEKDKEMLETFFDELRNRAANFAPPTNKAAYANQHHTLASTFYCLQFYLNANTHYHYAEASGAKFSSTDLTRKSKAHALNKVMWDSLKQRSSSEKKHSHKNTQSEPLKLGKGLSINKYI